ncbi:MAG: glycosyltransferase [Alphaproteobacteria bacterium]|jgi:polyisoprenyl-phosphate glycosyltransferase|nr:glycosyltransferase [Alphaproteobacteria bacterium]
MGKNVVTKKLISIIVPVFNEVDNLEPLLEALNPVLAASSDRYHFEIIFTDNHSTDGTFAKLQEIAKDDGRIRALRFSRNFGVQKSILTGLLNAEGDAAIQIDCDLQDPPELIPEFLKYWEEGNEVVYGVRRSRKENIIMNATRSIFYRIINWLSEIDVPLNAGDFRLIDRKILDLLAQVNDRSPYLRGIISTFGFRQVGIPYDRDERKHGKSKFTMGEYFLVALDGIISQSVVPLRLATHVGIAIAILMMMSILALIIGKWVFDADMPRGYPTTLLVILFGISLNALFLGIIGEYLARIYKQSVPAPLTIVEERFPKKD